MKRRHLILGLASAFVAAALWTARSSWLGARLRAPVQEALARSLGRPVRVAGLGATPDGWLWIRGLSVGPSASARGWDLSATAQAVGLKLDVWDLLRGRFRLEGLRAVRVVAPDIYAFVPSLPPSAAPPAPAVPAPVPSPEPTPWSLPDPGALRAQLSALPLPPVPLDLERGSFWTGKPGDLRLWARDARLSALPKDGGAWVLRAELSPWGQGKVSVSAAFGPGLSSPTVQAALRGLAYPPWLRPGGWTGQGRVDGTLSVRTGPGAWPSGWALKADGALEDGALAPGPGRPGLDRLALRWSLRERRLNLWGRGLCGGGAISARGWADLRARSVDLTVSARDCGLEALASLLQAPASLGLEGPSDFSLTVSGPWEDPSLGLVLAAPAAAWKGHPLRGIRIRAAGSAREGGSLQAQAAWDQGQGQVAVEGGPRGLRHASMTVDELPADWLGAFTPLSVTGRLDGRAEVEGGGAWASSFRARSLGVGDWTLVGPSVSASGQGRDGSVHLETGLPGRPRLSAFIPFQGAPDGWTLDGMRLFQKGVLLARADGSLAWKGQGTPARLSLTARVLSLDVGLLAPDLAARGWKGRLRGRASLACVGSACSGQVHAASASLQRGGWGYPFAADLDFGPARVRLDVPSLRDGELKGRLWAPAWRGPWGGDFALARAHLAAYAALVPGAPAGLSGTASGALAWEPGPSGRWRADLEFSDPLPGLLPGAEGRVALARRGGRWDLRSLKLRQGGGRAWGSGGWDPQGGEAWTGGLDWQDLSVSGRRSSGRLRLSGGGAAPGRVRLDPWRLGGALLPGLDASFTFAQGGLRRASGTLGPACSWVLQRGSGADWGLEADARGLDPGPWAALLPGRSAGPGPLRVSGTIRAGFSLDGRPTRAEADLRDGGGGRLKAAWTLLSGTASVRGSVRGLDLGAWSRELRAHGWGLPPLQGVASGGFEGRGPSVSLTASVERFGWSGGEQGPLSVSLGWGQGSVWVSQASLEREDGSSLELDQAVWNGSARSWSAAGSLSLTAWPLGVWTVGGAADVKASGQGPGLRWNAAFAPLQVGLRVWPRCALQGTWDGSAFTLRQSGRRPGFSAEGSWGGGAFTLARLRAADAGGVGAVSGRMAKGGGLDFTAASKGLPASDLAQVMGWPQDWSGKAWGTVRVGGALGRVHTVVSLKVEDGSVQGLPFDLGTALVVQDGEWVDLSPRLPIRISRGDGTAFEVSGRVPLDYRPAEGLSMDVRARLVRGGLDLLSGLPAVRSARGPFTLALRFRGDPDDPKVDGSFMVEDGSLDPAWLLPKLQGVRVLAQIRDSRVSLREAEATAEGDAGILRVGTVDPSKPAFTFRGWLPADLNLRLSSGRAGLPLRDTRALGFVSGLAHADLTLGGSWERPLLGGAVRLERGFSDRAVVQWPPEFPAGKSGDDGSWFSRLGYDLALKTGPGVMVRTSAAEVFVDTGADGLRVESVGPDVQLYGRLRLLQGSVDYLLATFQLAPDHESGLDFRGSEEPELDLWGLDDLGNVAAAGASDAGDVQVLLHAWGPLGSVQTSLEDQNDPSLTQDQLAGLIGMGGGSGDPRSQGGFTRMLGALPSSLLSRLARRTGLLDEVQLSSPALDQEAAPTPDAAGPAGPIQPLAVATPESATARSLLELSAGRYLGSNLFVGVDTQFIQRPALQGGYQYNQAVGGVVQYQLPNHARISAEQDVNEVGQTDDRVMLEGTSHFDNYDPQRRRWDLLQSPTPSPAPAPGGSPVPSPTPAASPASGPGAE